MRIGIDISQITYEGTGVSQFIVNLVKQLVRVDDNNQYILFLSSLRKQFSIFNFQSNPPHLNPLLRGERERTKELACLTGLEKERVKIKTFKFPPVFLDFLWNKLHIIPIEWFVGDVDIFITSDWTEPPTVRAKKATILYDLIVYKHPNETDKKIVETQKRKLKWVKKESDIIFCISEATKKDAMDVLGIEEKRLRVIYPGI